MRRYEIWSEGCIAQGNGVDGHDKAKKLGEAEASCFREAVVIYVRLNPTLAPYLHFHNGVPTIWGCRLFDNEVDARKSFG